MTEDENNQIQDEKAQAAASNIKTAANVISSNEAAQSTPWGKVVAGVNKADDITGGKISQTAGNIASKLPGSDLVSNPNIGKAANAIGSHIGNSGNDMQKSDAAKNLAEKTGSGNPPADTNADKFNNPNKNDDVIKKDENGNDDTNKDKPDAEKTEEEKAKEKEGESDSSADADDEDSDDEKKKKKKASGDSEGEEDDDGDSNSDSEESSSDDFKPKGAQVVFKYAALLIVLPTLLLIVLVTMIIAVFFSMGDTTSEYFKNLFTRFRDIESEQLEKDYYDELKKVQNKTFKADKVCIDINLINATLTINLDPEEMVDQGDKPEDYDKETYDKRMKKQVQLLANMQIKRKKYGWDTRLPVHERLVVGAPSKYCTPSGESQPDEVVKEDTKQYFKFDNPVDEVLRNFHQLDSETPEKVAQHDANSFFAFFMKKANEERNYEYNFYRPSAEKECLYKLDENGNCPGEKYIDVCRANMKKPTAELDIGTLETMKDSVYYWNLVNSFIPEYYKNYLPSQEPARTQRIHEIAEDIYLLYTDMGPSQNCKKNTKICGSAGDEEISGAAGNPNEWANSVAPMAIDEMERTGVAASITIAQAALESGWGGTFSSKYNNYYGMTAGCTSGLSAPDAVTGTVLGPGEGGNTCTGNDFWDGTIVAACNSQGVDCQWYRVYDSFANSTRDHSRLIVAYGCNQYSGYAEQIQCIKDHGYATDPDYVSKVKKIIHDYGLEQFDIAEWDGYIDEDGGPQYSSIACSTCDIDGWRQNDPTWGGTPLSGGYRRSDGTWYTPTLGGVGCFITSIANIIQMAGIETTLGDSFDPGTFTTALRDLGNFDVSGNFGSFDNATRIAPSLHYAGRQDYSSVEQVADLLAQGYYIMIHINHHNGNNHYMVICDVDVATGELFIVDSGGFINETGGLFASNIPNMVIRELTLFQVG